MPPSRGIGTFKAVERMPEIGKVICAGIDFLPHRKIVLRDNEPFGGKRSRGPDMIGSPEHRTTRSQLCDHPRHPGDASHTNCRMGRTMDNPASHRCMHFYSCRDSLGSGPHSVGIIFYDSRGGADSGHPWLVLPDPESYLSFWRVDVDSVETVREQIVESDRPCRPHPSSDNSQAVGTKGPSR